MYITEFGQGIYRAKTLEIREERRGFLEELTATVPICPMRSAGPEIIAKIDGKQTAFSFNLPLGEMMIGACALELGCAVATSNARDFERIPDLKLISLQAKLAGVECRRKRGPSLRGILDH